MKYLFFMKKKYMSYIMANKPQFTWEKIPQWRTFTAVFTIMPTPTLSEERTGLSLPEKLIHPAGE
jgi:hypothetical protein